MNALIRKARQYIEKQNTDTAWLAVAIKEGKDLGNIQQISLISAYSLALWCLQGKKSCNGLGFPFDRPLLEFAQRLLTINDYLPEIKQWLPDNDRIGNRLFSKLANKVSDLVQDPEFAQSVQELQWRCPLFDDLRKEMRIAEPGSNKGLNDDGTEKIRDGFFRFLCPMCNEFQTAVNPVTNLARCFRCQKNFNTIDLVMKIKGYGFKESVFFLKRGIETRSPKVPVNALNTLSAGIGRPMP